VTPGYAKPRSELPWLPYESLDRVRIINSHNFTPVATWTPADITTALWLDAADPSTLFDATSGGSFPANGGNVRRWEDKSGNARHYTIASNNPTRSAAAVNGKDSVAFATNQCLRRSDSGYPTGNLTFCMVARTNSSFSDGQYACCMHYGANSIGSGVFIQYGTDSAQSISNGISVSQFGASSGVSSATNADIVFAVTRSGTTYNTRLNGGASTSSRVMTTNTSLSGFTTIGAYNASLGGAFLTGRISEIVLVNSNSSDLEKIEGYLAHKWGTTASLPSGHPYETVAP